MNHEVDENGFIQNMISYISGKSEMPTGCQFNNEMHYKELTAQKIITNYLKDRVGSNEIKIVPIVTKLVQWPKCPITGFVYTSDFILSKFAVKISRDELNKIKIKNPSFYSFIRQVFDGKIVDSRDFVL